MVNGVLLTGFYWYGESARRWPVGLSGMIGKVVSAFGSAFAAA